MKSALRSMVFGAVVCSLVSPASAAAVYGFNNVTNNKPTDAAIGEAQLSVTVSDNGGGTVLFQYNNAGPLASSITDIYFDDNSVPALFVSNSVSIINGSGVSFSASATPSNLPGGTNVGFSTSFQLSADSDPPVVPNGVGPGETVGIVLTLASGQKFTDVVNALNAGVLRTGIHVQGFASGGSESFVNNPGGGSPPPVVPEPSSLVLMGLAGLGMVAQRRRNAKRKSQQ